MSKQFSTPQEIAVTVIDKGIKKAEMSPLQMLLLGSFAGALIGFGAQGAITIMQTLGNIDAGLAKFAGAAVFPVGLILVLIAGGELFTGNNLMSLALMDKKITLFQILRNWFFVYMGNFIGSVLLAQSLASSGLLGKPGKLNATGELAVNMANAKVSLGFVEVLLRGIMCNILVVLAVWLTFSAQDIISKIFACWFPVMLFVLSGFEHSIANMYYIPLGMFMGADTSWTSIWFNNLIPVTLGNILGGAVIVPIVYYTCFVGKTTKAVHTTGDNSSVARQN